MAIPGLFGSIVQSLTDAAADLFAPDEDDKSSNPVENPDIKRKNIDMGQLSDESKEALEINKEQQNQVTPPMPDPATDPSGAQKWLNEHGNADIGVDGQFGWNSQKALAKYRRMSGADLPKNASAMTKSLTDAGIAIRSYKGMSEEQLEAAGKAYKEGGEFIPYHTNELGSGGGDISPELVKAATPFLKDLQDNSGIGNFKTKFGQQDTKIEVTASDDKYHRSDDYYATRIKSDFASDKSRKRDRSKKSGYTGGEVSQDQIKAYKKQLGKWNESEHTHGNNFDFVVNGADGAAKVRTYLTSKGWDKEGTYFISPDKKYKIKDEYKHGSAAKSGDHFHFALNK